MNTTEPEAGSKWEFNVQHSPLTTENLWMHRMYDALAHWPSAHPVWTKANASCGFYMHSLWSWTILLNALRELGHAIRSNGPLTQVTF